MVFLNKSTRNWGHRRAQELCESRGGRPEPPVPNKLCGVCGGKAAFEEEEEEGAIVNHRKTEAGPVSKATPGN